MNFTSQAHARLASSVIWLSLILVVGGCNSGDQKEQLGSKVREADGEALMLEMNCVESDCKLDVSIVNTSEEAVLFDINVLIVPGFQLVDKLPMTRRLDIQRQEIISVNFKKVSPNATSPGEGSEIQYVVRFVD